MPPAAFAIALAAPVFTLVCRRSNRYRSNLNADAFYHSPPSFSERALPAGRPVPQPGNIRHMTSKLQEDTHFRVLRLLQENPEMSQRELARAVGTSIGGMHYVLAALIDKGFVKLGNFAAAGDRRRYAYILTPTGIAHRTKSTLAFLKRKRAEYEALRQEIEALQAELPDTAADRLRPEAAMTGTARTGNGAASPGSPAPSDRAGPGATR